MLLRFIQHNPAISILLVPVGMIVFWIYTFFHPVIPVTEHAAPLYKLLIMGIKTYPFLIIILSMLLIFCEAMLLNNIAEKNAVVGNSAYLPALLYIILMSLQPEMFSLHPIIIANLFLLLALRKLMQTYRKETAYSETFETGLFISVAALFYIPSFVFILLLWTGLFIIRPFIWREWFISLIGFILPWLYLVFFYFWNNKLDMLEYEALYYTIITPRKVFNIFNFSFTEYSQLALLIVAVLFSAGRFIHDLNKGAVQTRNNLMLLFYFFLFGFISVFLAPVYSIAYLSFLSIPFSIIFSRYLLHARRKWIAEILFLLLIVSVLANQFFQ